MGLDGMELLLAVEEEFAVSIKDEDAENLITPRLLADYIVARLGTIAPDTDRCLSQAGFYRIRSALVRNFGAQRKDVRPDALIEQFLNGNRRVQWVQLREAIDARSLPGLVCKKTIAYPLTLGMPLIGATLLFLGGASIRVQLGAVLVLWILALVTARKLADVVPENLRTVRAVVPYVRIEKKAEWTPGYVLQRVIQITAEQIGMPAEKILPDQQFIKDLGLN